MNMIGKVKVGGFLIGSDSVKGSARVNEAGRVVK